MEIILQIGIYSLSGLFCFWLFYKIINWFEKF